MSALDNQCLPLRAHIILFSFSFMFTNIPVLDTFARSVVTIR